MTNTIMLIHGAWLNAKSWENWKAYYEAKGYNVVAPDWPLDDRDPKELREHPNKALAQIGQREILDHFEAKIRALPEEPILIGHSAGGVFVQHLLDRGLGVAGVAIDPAPTPGVPLGPQAIISALPVLGDLFSFGTLKSMSRNFFKTRFAQTAPKQEADALYDRYIVPTAAKVYWNGVINPIKIDWKNPARAPLLIIVGEKDLIADASMAQAIYKKQKQAPSRTAFKKFPHRSHWIAMDPGWQEVADYALDFAVRNARASNVSPIRSAA